MIGLLKKYGLIKIKSGPDYNHLESNDVNISGIQFQFSVPGNGSKFWGTRNPVPKTLNLYSESYATIGTGFLLKNITAEVWDYFGYFWQGLGGHWGDIKTRWEIARIPEEYGKSVISLANLQEYLEQFNQEYYEGPEGLNTQIRNDWEENEMLWGKPKEHDLYHLPDDYQTININGREWLWYSIQMSGFNNIAWYYSLPIVDGYFLLTSFIFDTTDDLDGKIITCQKEEAKKIASYMKVTFPDEEGNN